VQCEHDAPDHGSALFEDLSNAQTIVPWPSSRGDCCVVEEIGGLRVTIFRLLTRLAHKSATIC
jgi:hypothetical protein